MTVSLDCVHAETEAVIDKWSQKNPNIVKVSSFQRFHVETGDQARLTDERLTRHWLSANVRMFSESSCQYVIYAEDDQIISHDFQSAAEKLIRAFDMCPTCIERHNDDMNNRGTI